MAVKDFRAAGVHFEMMVDFMEKNPQMIPERSIGSGGLKGWKSDLWAQLSDKLNAAGSGTKSPEKWHKAWTDFKYASKKKCREMQLYNGSKSGRQKSLTPLEQRMMLLCGWHFSEEENGKNDNLAYINGSYDYDTSQLPTSTSDNISHLNNTFKRSSDFSEYDSMMSNKLQRYSPLREPSPSEEYLQSPSDYNLSQEAEESSIHEYQLDPAEVIKHSNSCENLDTEKQQHPDIVNILADIRSDTKRMADAMEAQASTSAKIAEALFLLVYKNNEGN